MGLEGLGYIFQKISQRNVLLIFTTTSQEVIKEVTDEIKRKKHSISSYSTESSKLGDMTTYRVTMVIRTHKTGDETLLFQFIQHLPDVMIDRDGIKKATLGRFLFNFHVWSVVSVASDEDLLQSSRLRIHHRHLQYCRFWLP